MFPAPVKLVCRHADAGFKMCLERSSSSFFILPHDVRGQRDDSGAALHANHVPLHNYPRIYGQDVVLIKSGESELVS